MFLTRFSTRKKYCHAIRLETKIAAEQTNLTSKNPKQQIETAINTIDLLATFIGERALHTFISLSLEPELPIANASSDSKSPQSVWRK